MSEDRFSAGAPGGREADTSPDAAEGPSRFSPAPSSEPTFLERLAGLFRQRNGSSLREDLTDALAESEEAGAESFSPGERAMLANILRLREVSVEDVMIPRAGIEGVELDTSLAELMLIFERSGHSRMPVYKDSLDDPQGMVHIRDVLAHITRAARTEAGDGIDLGGVDLNRTIAELNLIRSVLFVPPSMLASELMTRMQTSRTQMALVIDEYGGTDGLVSLEDIVETVVGDIEDEHDEEENLVTVAGDDAIVADGKAHIEEVARAFGAGFSAGGHADYVDTIGGLLVAALGRVPNRGEVLEALPGFEFHVVDADPRRVKTVRIVRIPPAGEPAAALPAA
jgi:CBS domain containing-hemolysin-like protein